jgi:large repetitive protein
MKKLLVGFLLVFQIASFSQVKNPFDIRYQTIVRGDLTMISNNIVSKTPTSQAYNLLGNASEVNDNIDMQFIDIDEDQSTFNSSSAVLSIADQVCSKIVYAGLYWSGTYRYTVGNNSNSGRFEDWNTIKFKVPNGNYIDIPASDILYNGFADVLQTNVEHGPYACYADVTSLVSNLSNPNGNYFVGNVRISTDGRSQINGTLNPNRIPGGVSGGWSLVIVYENINLPGKKITTFDGYAVVGSATTLEIPVNGFQTLPVPIPVKARAGFMATEGDNKINGDQLLIKANNVNTFTNLTNTPLPSSATPNNFFNSSITLNGSFNLNRNPNSLNTLGWDSHLNTLNNPLNSVLPNNETGVTLKAISTQDKYDIFFASFDVEIIEPNIFVLNEAESLSGLNITGQSVSMGESYFYKIAFKNSGNDDAQNFKISNQLPKNVIFPINGNIEIGNDIILPTGVTFTYNPLLKDFNFIIPNNLVTKNSVINSIRIKVKVENDCANLETACSNIISNQVFSTYQGTLNPMIISNNPSSSQFNLCSLPISSATNVIANIDQCVFIQNEFLCAGSNSLLSAPNGYESYVWTLNGNEVGNTQFTTVSELGTYIVSMSAPTPCISITKTFNVIDCTLSNKNFTFSNFKTFPNPVKNTLTISNASTIETIEISSILGQKIISKNVNDLQTEIDMSQLTNGIYFVKVTSQGNEKTIKIVKE